MRKHQFVAISDYRPEDYPRIYALAPDGGGMEKTFEEWKAFADEAVVFHLGQGDQVVRVLIEPDEFAAWLRAKRLKSTPDSRARFALEIAMRKHAAH